MQVAVQVSFDKVTDAPDLDDGDLATGGTACAVTPGLLQRQKGTDQRDRKRLRVEYAACTAVFHGPQQRKAKRMDLRLGEA